MKSNCVCTATFRSAMDPSASSSSLLLRRSYDTYHEALRCSAHHHHQQQQQQGGYSPRIASGSPNAWAAVAGSGAAGMCLDAESPTTTMPPPVVFESLPPEVVQFLPTDLTSPSSTPLDILETRLHDVSTGLRHLFTAVGRLCPTTTATTTPSASGGGQPKGAAHVAPTAALLPGLDRLEQQLKVLCSTLSGAALDCFGPLSTLRAQEFSCRSIGATPSPMHRPPTANTFPSGSSGQAMDTHSLSQLIEDFLTTSPHAAGIADVVLTKAEELVTLLRSPPTVTTTDIDEKEYDTMERKHQCEDLSQEKGGNAPSGPPPRSTHVDGVSLFQAPSPTKATPNKKRTAPLPSAMSPSKLTAPFRPPLVATTGTCASTSSNQSIDDETYLFSIISQSTTKNSVTSFVSDESPLRYGSLPDDLAIDDEVAVAGGDQSTTTIASSYYSYSYDADMISPLTVDDDDASLAGSRTTLTLSTDNAVHLPAASSVLSDYTASSLDVSPMSSAATPSPVVDHYDGHQPVATGAIKSWLLQPPSSTGPSTAAVASKAPHQPPGCVPAQRARSRSVDRTSTNRTATPTGAPRQLMRGKRSTGHTDRR